MTRHLKSCRQKNSAETVPEGQGLRKAEVFYLVVEGRYAPDYWMHLEVPANAKLEVLDIFLRDIWLECCGHMSMFSIQGQKYSVALMADFGDKSMKVRLDAVLSPGIKFEHEYDFGSTTHLKLKVVSQEQKQIKSRDIVILARNEPPSYPCMSCGKTSVHICTEYMWAGDGCLCEKCAAEHKCGEDMLLPVVNSPRVGVCGYTGD